MIAIPGRTVVQKISAVVLVSCYVLMVLFFGLIAHEQFNDRRLLETGSKVESTIVTVSPRKGHTWGTIRYRLPDGSHCNDWTELAPNGGVHLGEPLTVAVGQTCGHAVSTKKRLMPWVYLVLFVGGALHLSYVVWKATRTMVAA